MIPIRGSVRSATLPLVTIALIAANTVAFIGELMLPEPALNELVVRWGVVPARQTWALATQPLALDQWLFPIFTSMFLHGGWMHLLGNMLFLWVFGDGLEGRLGGARFALLYLAAGVIASQAQVLVDPAAMVPMIGASGAVAGVLGAYLLAFPLARVVVVLPILFIPLFFEVPALVFLVLWFFEQVYLGTMSTLTPTAQAAASIAWFAHIGGFATGAVLLFVLKPAGRTRVYRLQGRRGW